MSTTENITTPTTLTVVDGRVPKVVSPTHYAVTYRYIDLKNFAFEGQVTIDLEACQECPPGCESSLVLHARELSITHAKLCLKDSSSNNDNEKDTVKEWNAIEFRYQLHHETCHIVFDNSNNFEIDPCIWQPGKNYQLTMEFQGILNNQMAGLYRSQYTNLQGQRVTMATTQFEPTDARRAFPCLDEPALKATFQLTVTIPAHLQVISNTPIVASHTRLAEGNNDTNNLIKTVTFEKTPKMSTYLVALVVGEFDSIAATSKGIQTTIYTVPGKAHQGQFCLETASRCLDFLQEIYGVPYPLPKSDLLAIPDFAAGAMENWGCCTYREAKILVTSQTSETIRRGIARTVCHELAHQWFGNLVTPEFWTQLWLKEGVARFMEFVALDQLFPEWHAWDEFVQSVYNLALQLDAMSSSHPVEVEVHHSDEINDIFDSISYAKGASIIRMVCHYIGMDTFMKGMRLYLTRHAYANAISNDFWSALSEVSGKNLVDFMATWTKVMGYPLLQLLHSDNQLTMTTNRFHASGKSDEATDDAKWPMPVTALVEGVEGIQGPWVIHGPQADESNTLLQKVQEWEKSGKWFKLNVHQHNFYRVNYTTAQWQRLAAANVMDPAVGILSVVDRLGLVSDSFAAGKSGYASIVDSLQFVEGFGSHETSDYVVWQELSSNLSSLASMYRSEPFFPQFQTYLRKLYTKQAQVLGWESAADESARTGTLRGTVLRMMGVANDTTIIEEGFKRFVALTKSSNDALETGISGDLRRVVLRLALRHDERAVLQSLKDILDTQHATLSPETQRDCLVVMGCVKDPKHHADMLDYVLRSGKVRFQDMAFPLGSLAGTTDDGGRATWKYFKTNFAELKRKFGGGFQWRDIVGLCGRGLRTKEEAQQLESFFNDPSHPPGAGARRLKQALEVIRTQADRLDRDRDALVAYFRS